MNDLKIFENERFGRIRTVKDGDRVLFCGSDIAKSLGYVNPNKAVNDHCRAITKRATPISGKNQYINFIGEGDVYRLIASSRLPQAIEFERWVFDDVLPTIRKTGGYVADENAFINTYLPYADEQTKNMFSATLQTVRNLNAKIEQDKPKVLFANSVEASKTSILIGDLAKLIKQNGVDIGQKRLFEWLRVNGYLIKQYGTSHNMPTQRAMEQGLFGVKETAITHSDGHISISKTVKVTGKGQTFFVNKFLGQR